MTSRRLYATCHATPRMVRPASSTAAVSRRVAAAAAARSPARARTCTVCTACGAAVDDVFVAITSFAVCAARPLGRCDAWPGWTVRAHCLSNGPTAYRTGPLPIEGAVRRRAATSVRAAAVRRRSSPQPQPHTYAHAAATPPSRGAAHTAAAACQCGRDHQIHHRTMPLDDQVVAAEGALDDAMMMADDDDGVRVRRTVACRGREVGS